MMVKSNGRSKLACSFEHTEAALSVQSILTMMIHLLHN